MSFSSLLDILRCPACVNNREPPDPGQLELLDDRWFICRDCDRKYPIRDRIPVMLIEEGTKYRHLSREELPDTP